MPASLTRWDPFAELTSMRTAMDRLFDQGLGRFPGLWHRVRVRGSQKAEQFRASRVWPRLLQDAIADVTAFGSARP